MIKRLMVAFVVAAVTVVLSATAAPSSTSRDVKLLVITQQGHARVPPEVVAASGGRVVAEYASMTAIAVPEARLAALAKSLAGSGFDTIELGDEILTPRGRIDTVRDMPPEAPYVAGLFLIQYVAPSTPAWQGVLRSSGLTQVDSLPDRTVVAAGTAAAVAQLAKLPWVQYAGPYLPAFKYAPTYAAEHGQFTVMIADTEDAASTLAWIDEQTGGVVAESQYGGQRAVRVYADLTLALRFLEEPFVLGVEAYVPPAPSDERQALSVTGASSPVGGNYLNWLNARGITPNVLTDSQIVVDIADTGIDNGCTAAGHLDLEGRRVYSKGIAPLSGTIGDTSYHGTMVAGIVGGNPGLGKNIGGGTTNGFGYKDGDSYGSFYYGLGVAPGVRLGSTKMTSTNGSVGTVAQWTTSAVTSYCSTTPTDPCSQTVLCRAVVQNHSHNEYDDTGTSAGVYTSNAREFDISVRNAERGVPGTPLAITISAGNYRQRVNDATTRVLAPGTSKNAITVGAAESARDPIPACTTDPVVENPVARHSAQGYNALAYASRRGTNDLRLKPDLVAPATLAMGPRSAALPGPSGATCVQGGGGGGTYLWPQYQGTSGTSFAAPVAAGAIALLRQYYNANYSLQPSPAMYKAMLVAGARSISGSVDRQTGSTLSGWPKAEQGFGLIGLDDLFNATINKGWHDQGTVLLQGQIREFTVTVDDELKPVRIVLTWTDAPALAGSAITQVNNLNLMSYGPDKYRFLGNYTSTSGYSVLTIAGTPLDSRNNVEVLNINPSRFVNVANRTFTVRVTAAALNGEGVPGASGGANNQDFSLFVLNGTLQ